MLVKNLMCLTLVAGLGGCATLPSSGPTGGQIEKSVRSTDATAPIRLVQIETVADVPAAVSATANAAALTDLAPPPTDMVGPGDVLDINIYEAGVTLFSGGGASVSPSQAAPTPGVQVQKLPPVRIDDLGNIRIPYAGKLHAAGHTVSEVEAMIRTALRRVSQNPQVSISVEQMITNSIIVGGEVAKPGRLILQTNRETLSDVIALTGGYKGSARDLTLRVIRGDKNVDIRLNDLADNPALDVRAYPGDRLILISNPRSYSVLGAPGHVEQVAFTRSSVSIAEAIANSGGVNPGVGNPAAIFLFRYVRDAQGNESPVVYHLNMMKAGSYFVAQRFTMQDKDVLYFGNAAANQPSKLIQLISQLFSPVLTVTSAVQTVQRSGN